MAAPQATPPQAALPLEPLDPLAQVWEALVVGTRDFARCNRFAEAVVGLHGGIESAVTAAVAVDALGPDNVLAVTAPSRATAAADLDDARTVAGLLGVRLVEIDLAGVVGELAAAVHRTLDALDPTAGERLMLRTRAAALWAVADEGRRLLLASGNKSELSLGAAVRGGDLVGHYAPLADCPKTLIAELARHRNARGPVLPERVLDKAVTAERAGSVPDLDWAVVDEVVERYLERMQEMEDIPSAVAGPERVAWIAQQVIDAELDRRLAPMGVRVSGRAFGKDRRVPVAQAWRPSYAARSTAGDGGGRGPAEEGPA